MHVKAVAKSLTLSLFFLVVSCSASDADNSSADSANAERISDLSSEDLTLIKKQLGGCKAPADKAAILGCAIVKSFSVAHKPDKKQFEVDTPIDGRRWLGVTVNLGEASKDREEFTRKSPYINLVIFGVRYSESFHQQISFSHGMSATYVWPTRKQEVPLIEGAAEKLQKNIVDTKNPAVKFANKTELEFEVAKPSAGGSLLLGNPNRFLRQNGNTLLLIEKEEFEGAKVNFLLSQIDLKNAL